MPIFQVTQGGITGVGFRSLNSLIQTALPPLCPQYIGWCIWLWHWKIEPREKTSSFLLLGGGWVEIHLVLLSPHCRLSFTPWLSAFHPLLALSSPEAACNAESLHSHILLTTDLVPEAHRSPHYFKAPMLSGRTWPPDAVAHWYSLKYSYCF